MSIPVLYEDNHLLAVVKPPGFPSQEDETGDPDMLTLLKHDLKKRHNKPGNVFLGLVHRLDRPVGGAMIFAKTSKAASRLSEAVRSRNFGKTYMCVAHGVPARREATLVHYIRKDAKRNQVTVFDRPAPDAKEAVLSYTVVAESGGISLIAVKLETGRPHQIRAQLARIGCPLVGDLKYGARKYGAVSDIALWSTSVTVPHPVTGATMLFRSVPERSGVWQAWPEQTLTAAAELYAGPRAAEKRNEAGPQAEAQMRERAARSQADTQRTARDRAAGPRADAQTQSRSRTGGTGADAQARGRAAGRRADSVPQAKPRTTPGAGPKTPGRKAASSRRTDDQERKGRR